MSDSTKHVRSVRRLMILVLTVALICAAFPAQAATAIYQITTDKVNLRSAPSTDAEVLLLVRAGSEVRLLSSRDDGWCKVSVNGTVGYMSLDYLTLSGIVNSQNTLTAVVTASRLNVRASASTSGKQLGLALRGDTFTVTAMTGDWLAIVYNGKTAYIASQYVRLSADQDGTPVTVPTAVPAPTATPTPTQKPAAVYTITLKVGDKGNDVANMQQMLIALGYLTGTADGIFGTGTRTGVIKFQRTVGLNVDGVAGPTTLNALAAAYNALPAAPTVPTPTAAPSADASLLKKGSRGDAVKALQQNLITLGYLTGTADGIFGNATLTAVRAFQAANGLTVDGEVGSKTKAAIAAAVSAIETAKTLQSGSRGDAVKALQQKLIALGFLSGSADGVYGAKTKAAVTAFQQRHNLTADGVANPATQAAINAAYAANPTPANDNSHTTPGNTSNDNVVINVGTDVTTYPVLKYGATGVYVEALQSRLKTLGYFTGNIGGNFGTLTQTAVIAFQTASGLKADGIVGAITWASLFASTAPAAQTNTLTEGSKGNAVETLQTRLKELGYYTYSVDGEYGPRTTAAVAAFQAKAGMNVDGVAGPATLTAIYAANAPVATSPAQPTGYVNGGVRDTDLTVANQIVALAKQQLGCKYVYAREAPPYFDCSGLTQYCYGQFGYKLKRTAYEQGYDNTWPKITRIEDLQVGDCIYFNTNNTDSDLCDHAGIYLGNNSFIHASSSAGKVVIGTLASGFYRERFSWGRRVLGQTPNNN